jgi:hypothetical protein
MQAMIPVAYESEKHYSLIATWWHQRKLPIIPEDFLPKTGFIIPGYAACFLYKTDSSVAILENLISEPKCKPHERDHALDLVILGCMAEAFRSGFSVVQGFTPLRKVRARMEKLNFKVSEKTFELVSRRL